MPRPTRLAAAAALGTAAVAFANAAPAGAQTAPGAEATLAAVASFEHQVTGVAVSEGGRIFVNFPRWTEDSPISVAEVLPDGSLRPYPNGEMNGWRNAKKNQVSAADHWVCVQSVVADSRGHVWAVDAAAPAMARVVEGGPKLVAIDLATDRVARTIAFDETLAPQGSYLNDVRFAPDGSHAYLTDSGAVGALLVVDLGTGEARRVLDGHPSTQVEKDVVVKVDGRELRMPDGRGAEFAADGLAISPDGSHLYWQAATGRTLYRIPTAALEDEGLSPTALAGRVETVGTNGVADGLLIDNSGRMWVTSPEDSSLKLREGGEIRTVLSDAQRLRWPDSLALGPDGTVYVTDSRIPESAMFKPETGKQLATGLWRVVPAGAASGDATAERAPAPKPEPGR